MSRSPKDTDFQGSPLPRGVMVAGALLVLLLTGVALIATGLM